MDKTIFKTFSVYFRELVAIDRSLVDGSFNLGSIGYRGWQLSVPIFLNSFPSLSSNN